MFRRNRTSPPPSRSVERLSLGTPLKHSVHDHGDSSPSRRSPRGSEQDRTWQGRWETRAKYLTIAIVCYLGTSWTYTSELRREARLGDELQAHPAGWLKENAVDPVQEQADKLKAHLRARLLRGRNASNKIFEKNTRFLDKIIEQEVQQVMTQDDKGGDPDDEFQDNDHDDTDDTEDLRVDEGTEDDDTTAEFQVPSHYADRHIENFLDIVRGETCKEPTVDLSDPNFDPNEAATIFAKCRLLIFRNAFDTEFLEEYRGEYTKFINGIKEGRISTKGHHTGGDPQYFASRGRGRYEIILPERLAHPDIVGNRKLLDVIQHTKVLGSHSTMRGFQSILAEGLKDHGAISQHWHTDDGYWFDSPMGSLTDYGIAGHDLPPAVASVAIPLLDIQQRNIGPTEFCMGTSALGGLGDMPLVMNQSLVEEGSLYRQMVDDDDHCPAECWQAPLLKFGDAVVWDYQLMHRGGWNTSPFLRSMVLLIYSRKWYDDNNFDDKSQRRPRKGEPKSVTKLLWRTRFGVPKHDEEPNEEVATPLQDLGALAPKYEGLEDFEENPSKQPFVFSNSNVDGNPMLYINGVLKGRLSAGKSKTVKCAFGDLIELRNGDHLLGQFSRCSDGGQFVFTQDGISAAAS